MSDEAVRLMMLDVARELVERAREASADAARSGSSYDKGRQFAFYEVVSLLVEQADAFGVDRVIIGLNEVDPERDLLGGSIGSDGREDDDTGNPSR